MKVSLLIGILSTIFSVTIATADDRLPQWLENNILSDTENPPLGIWQISHHNQIAFYIISPCCDQYNYLYDINGTPLCAPSGGISGAGDGKCPYPADNNESIKLVWKQSNLQCPIPYGLYKPIK